MMVAVFGTMLLSLLFGWFGRRGFAVASLFVCLFLSIWLFLWEIYSPEYCISRNSI
jgi:hypothetical protein